MKYIFISLLLFSSFMLAQDTGQRTSHTTEELQIKNTVITGQEGINITDDSIDSTEAFNANSLPPDNLSTLIIEFSPGILPGPANGLGLIQDGIHIEAVASAISTSSTIGGGPGGVSTTDPSFSLVTFQSINNSNSLEFSFSSKVKLLIANGTLIPYIEIFYLRPSGPSWLAYQIIRYENCVLNRYDGISEGVLTQHIEEESVSFFFTKACYRTYEYDENDILIGQYDNCWDRVTGTGGCSCSF